MDALMSHYDDYYGDPRLVEWRRLGAVDKAENVVDLWRRRQGNAQPVARVLDVGCGDGAIGRALAEHGFFDSYVGVDVSSTGIVEAQRQTKSASLHFERYDGGRLPFESGAFDLALLSHVLEHVDEPRTLVREAARVARCLFVEVPLELHMRTPRDFEWNDTGHINFFSPKVMRKLLQTVDLRVLEEEVRCSGLPVFRFATPGPQALARWAVYAGFLKAAPRLATSLMTYHGCWLVEPTRPQLDAEDAGAGAPAAADPAPVEAVDSASLRRDANA